MTRLLLRSYRLFSFLAFYAVEVVKSNLRVARDALSPRPDLSPGFLDLPLEPMNARQLWFLANLITMTPGTLTVHVDPERRTLRIHTLYLQDGPEAIIRNLKDNFETRVLRVF